MAETLTVYDARGRPKRLVRVGRVGVPWDGEETSVGSVDQVGAAITVQHTLDPEAQATLRELRRGAPVAAAVGGALVGAALVALLVWAMSDSE